MRIRLWWWRRQWRVVVASATTALGLCLGPAWASEEHRPVLPGAEGLNLAAVIPPPEVPPPVPVERIDPADVSVLHNPTVPPSLDPAPPGGVGGTLEGRPDEPTEAVPESPRPERVEPPVVAVSVPRYPLVVNATVEGLIDYFTVRERERERFGLWLARSGRYLGMIRRVLRERGLPEELAYTAMIESGFSPRAVSRAGAKGLWQFMEATARRYGLVVNRWVDERFDPVKSTIAAAQYLGDLHGMFGHWFLAQAAYNAGEARIARAIQLARSTDFWALTQTRHLPQETKLFVPQILAATVITRAPARYGFEVATEPPPDYDEVTVRHALDLETIGSLAGVTVEQVRELNLALRTGITPPFGPYALRLPAGTGERFEEGVRRAAGSGLTSWVVHRVGRNQTLADIARMYRVSPQRLAEVNQLRGGRLRGASELLVPARKAEPKSTLSSRVTSREIERASTPLTRAAGMREVVVRRGDTLAAVAERHGLSPHTLAQWNGRDLDEPLHPGDHLKLHTP